MTTHYRTIILISFIQIDQKLVWLCKAHVVDVLISGGIVNDVAYGLFSWHIIYGTDVVKSEEHLAIPSWKFRINWVDVV